jgi:hypothetical protein
MEEININITVITMNLSVLNSPFKTDWEIGFKKETKT